MHETISKLAVLPILLFSFLSLSQETINTGIQVKKKLSIEYEDGHSCMTQTRAATKEDALYNTDKCGAVKYELSKKGKFFSIYQLNQDKEWYKWGTYKVAHSFADEVNSSERISFLCEDGSVFTYVPNTESGSLVILDIPTEEVIHFIYD